MREWLTVKQKGHIYKHPKGEVWGISPSPSAEDLVFTCHKEGIKSPCQTGRALKSDAFTAYKSVQSNRVIEGATLWRLPEISTDETGRLTQNHHCGALVEVLRIEPAAPEDGIHK